LISPECQANAEGHKTEFSEIGIPVFEDATAVAVVPNVEPHAGMLAGEDVHAAPTLKPFVLTFLPMGSALCPNSMV